MEKDGFKFLKEGGSGIILVAPHGVPGDDDNTDTIAKETAKRLGCCAAINNTYRRPDDKAGEKTDVKVNVVDCNNTRSLALAGLKEKWLGPITHFREEMLAKGQVNSIGAKCCIFFIHGAKNTNVKKINVKADILIGVGKAKEDSEKKPRPTATDAAVQDFIKILQDDFGITAVEVMASKTGSGDLENEYAGHDSNNLNQQFVSRPGGKLDPAVQSFQLEIKKAGFRDTAKNAENTAKKLAEVIAKLTGVAMETQAELVAEKDIQDEGQDKIAAAVEHILAESRVAYKETINRMDSIGKYLVANFFGGNWEDARNPRKIEAANSLSQIQKNLKNHLGRASKSWVYDALKVSVDCHLLEGSDVFQTYGNLSNSHKVKLAYADEKDKKELIKLCDAEKWSVRELGAEIAKRRPERGKSKASSLLMLIRKPEILVDKLANSKGLFKEQLNELKPKEQEKIREAAKRQLEELDEKIQKLKAMKQQFAEMFAE